MSDEVEDGVQAGWDCWAPGRFASKHNTVLVHAAST